jgi:activating signal cointegrator 1
MKVISIWNPYAALIVHGHKTVETRSWPAPKSLIGQRIAIASTKVLRPEQKSLWDDPVFLRHYAETGLPALHELPNGAILGTALLHSCSEMTEEDLEDVTEEEQIYGHWDVGRFAWRLRQPELLDKPIFTRGFQGIWDHDVEAHRGRQERPPVLRQHLQLVWG